MNQKQHAPGAQGKHAGAFYQVLYKGREFYLNNNEFRVFSLLVCGGQLAGRETGIRGIVDRRCRQQAHLGRKGQCRTFRSSRRQAPVDTPRPGVYRSRRRQQTQRHEHRLAVLALFQALRLHGGQQTSIDPFGGERRHRKPV